MQYSEETLDRIFEKTDGRCHICWSALARSNYGSLGRRGVWEVEHSVPRANGGTNRLNNLFPAHVSCNRSKGTSSTRSARATYGNTRAPRSRAKQDEARVENTAIGAVAGGILTAVLLPELWIAGAIVGALFGNSIDVT